MMQLHPFQIAYVTNDVDQAAALFGARYGISRWTSLSGKRPDGGVIHCALAWVGPIMYELVKASGASFEHFENALTVADGFALKHHHTGHMLADEGDWARLEAATLKAGLPLVAVSETPGFMKSGFIWAPELGHWLEYLLPAPAAMDFFNKVERT